MLEIMAGFTSSQLDDIAVYIKNNGVYSPIHIYPIWNMINDCQAVKVLSNNKEVIIFQNDIPTAIYILNDNGSTKCVYYL
ncbi:hypothetical protein [Xenorhabdus bovienii]|uniref:hypothetical protein n=1 Tax=Xenorhabdus bovienii TaxID=40576 RepID=UPI0023B2BADB|nr:hypothetical protein [Xenorhabdus bovienii]MDE9429843.1 hypothetical protein [Xenorhabdus bovienii]